MQGKKKIRTAGSVDLMITEIMDTLDQIRLAIRIVEYLRSRGSIPEPDIAACLDLLKSFARAECDTATHRLTKKDLSNKQ